MIVVFKVAATTLLLVLILAFIGAGLFSGWLAISYIRNDLSRKPDIAGTFCIITIVSVMFAILLICGCVSLVV